MIKYLASTENGRRVLGMVITRQNIDYLLQQHPIHFNCEQMGLNEINIKEVIISYSENEETAQRDFKERGIITKDTIIHIDQLKKI